MRATLSEIKLAEEEFNDCPGRTQIETLLELHFRPGAGKFVVVDATDKDYWKNDRDTLVVAFDREDVWRFGADSSMNFAIGLAEFVRASKCNEFYTYTSGKLTVIRFWWD